MALRCLKCDELLAACVLMHASCLSPHKRGLSCMINDSARKSYAI